MKNEIQHWGVYCYVNHKQVLTIESNCVFGRNLSDEDQKAIRSMAEHLLAFVGERQQPVDVSSTGEKEIGL